MKTSTDNSPIASDFYKLIRGQIEHINNAINQRVVWLIIAQSFLFNGYALLINGLPEIQFMEDQQTLLMVIFPIASLIMVSLFYIDIIGSLLYLRALRKYYDAHCEDGDRLLPPVAGWVTFRRMEHFSSALLPLVFIIIWICIIVIKMVL